MVFLVHKLAFSVKDSSKFENQRHHSSEYFSASLQAFRSNISSCLTKLILKSDPESDFLSIKWLEQCFEVLPIVNKAFAKLVVEIDYPMSKWEVSCIEEYLDYSLSLLDYLNSISYALSHLTQARISLSHSLRLIERSPKKLTFLKQIKYKDFSNNLKANGNGESKEKNFRGKELILHEALSILKIIGSWVSSVVISGLCSDVEPYMDMKKSGNKYFMSTLIALDSTVCKKITENKEIVKEIKEVNDAVESLVSAIANGVTAESATELKRRLEVIEKVQIGIGEVVNSMFSDVLTVRNELINIVRRKQ